MTLLAMKRSTSFVMAFGVMGLAGCHRTPSEPASGSSGAKEAAVVSDSGAATAVADGIIFRGVWASGRNEAWAVGEKGTILKMKVDPDASTKVVNIATHDLLGIAGTGANDVWVSGEKGTLIHFDGTAWKVADGTKETDENFLLGLWLSGPKDVWMSGLRDETGELGHYDGAKWEMSPIGAAASLWAASGSGPKDVWMVGTDRANKGFVLRGDGKKFDRFAFDGGPLRAVHAVSPSDGWVAGYDGVIRHWDGKAWTVAQTPPHDQIHAMWGSGPSDVWATGAGGATLHYDGTTWTRPESGTKERLWGLSGTGTDDVWAVGGAILHWNGKRWSKAK